MVSRQQPQQKAGALYLKASATREALPKLAVSADVFVQNFCPGIVERMGLGEGELRKVVPACCHGAGGRHLPRTESASKPMSDEVSVGLQR